MGRKILHLFSSSFCTLRWLYTFRCFVDHCSVITASILRVQMCETLGAYFVLNFWMVDYLDGWCLCNIFILWLKTMYEYPINKERWYCWNVCLFSLCPVSSLKLRSVPFERSESLSEPHICKQLWHNYAGCAPVTVQSYDLLLIDFTSDHQAPQWNVLNAVSFQWKAHYI